MRHTPDQSEPKNESITKSGEEESTKSTLFSINERWTTSFDVDCKIRGKRRGFKRNLFFLSLRYSSSESILHNGN
jgi:hypothetical protein